MGGKQISGSNQWITKPCRVATRGNRPPCNLPILLRCTKRRCRGRTLMACICCALHTVQARRSTIFLVVFACRAGTAGTAGRAGQGATDVTSAGWQQPVPRCCSKLSMLAAPPRVSASSLPLQPACCRLLVMSGLPSSQRCSEPLCCRSSSNSNSRSLQQILLCCAAPPVSTLPHCCASASCPHPLHSPSPAASPCSCNCAPSCGTRAWSGHRSRTAYGRNAACLHTRTHTYGGGEASAAANSLCPMPPPTNAPTMAVAGSTSSQPEQHIARQRRACVCAAALCSRPPARRRSRPPRPAGGAPWAYSDALPVLYWVTLCMVCFWHSLPLQKAFLVFGTFTCSTAQHPD